MNTDMIKLAEALKDIKFTMFTTVGEDGNLLSRPMATLEINAKKFDGKIWFFTDINSPKVFNIANDQHVNLAYASPENQKYISVCGRASLVEDREMMNRLWTPAMKAWFPEGVNDPNIALICVEVESAELWDSPPSKVVQLAGMVKAVATGERYNGEKHHHHFDVRGHHS
jgi:general stress protein 26